MEEFFRNEPIRNKNCLWWPCLLTYRDEMCNVYRGPSIDVFLPSSVHLAKWFRRRFFLNRPIRNKELPVAAMFVNRSGQNEWSLERTIHSCFLPSFNSFGREVLEEKIKMWKAKKNTNICAFFFLSGSKAVQDFYCLFIAVFSLKIPLSKLGLGSH